MNSAGLSSADSDTLLLWKASQRDIFVTKEQTKRISQVTGGIPLAMLWVVGQLAMFGYPVDKLLNQFSLDPNSPVLQYCFHQSWNHLQTEPQQLLFALSLHPDPTSRQALKEITKLAPPEQCDFYLGHLLQLSLIDHDQEQDRFSLLSLTRAFVRSQHATERTLVQQLELAMAEYYLKQVLQQSDFKNWRDYEGLLRDRNNIISSAQSCYKYLKQTSSSAEKESAQRTVIAEMLVKFGTNFGSVLWQRAFWYDRLVLAHAGIEAAQLLADWKSVGTFARNIAWIHFYQGDYARAQSWATTSLQEVQQTNEPLLISAAKRALGTIEQRLKHFDTAKQLLIEVIQTCQQYSEDDYALYSLGFAQNGLGDLEYEQGNLVQAEHWYQTALETWQTPGRTDPIRHTPYSYNGLGFVALRQGKIEQARQFFQQSLAAAEEFGRAEHIARAKSGLAEIALHDSSPSQGLCLAKEALDIFDKLGMQHEIRLVHRLLRLFGETPRYTRA